MAAAFLLLVEKNEFLQFKGDNLLGNVSEL